MAGLNEEFQLIPSASRTAVFASDVQQNNDRAGVVLILDITVGAATGGLMPQIFVINPDTGTQEIVTRIPLPVRAVGSYAYHFYPGANRKGTRAQFFACMYLPKSWFCVITPDDASPITYSMAVQYVQG